jgi:hypothetical protein
VTSGLGGRTCSTLWVLRLLHSPLPLSLSFALLIHRLPLAICYYVIFFFLPSLAGKQGGKYLASFFVFFIKKLIDTVTST